MKAAYHTGNRDRNEAEIIRVVKAMGIRVTRLKPGDGADLLVWVRPIQVWEIKNPAQKPSDRLLTGNELEALDYCAREGIPYRVIETVDEAVAEINALREKESGL